MLPFSAPTDGTRNFGAAPLPSAIIIVSLDAPWRQESDVVGWNHAHLQDSEYHWIHWNREQKSPKCLHGHPPKQFLHMFAPPRSLAPCSQWSRRWHSKQIHQEIGHAVPIGRGTLRILSHTVLWRASKVRFLPLCPSFSRAVRRSHWHCYVKSPGREVRTQTMPPPASRRQPWSRRGEERVHQLRSRCS